MAYKTIDPREVELALERIDGARFEKFGQAFYAAIQGTSYIPLGGLHDGGAEGFEMSGVSEGETPGRFIQMSVRKDVRVKIRQTVKRLREFGRDPKQLVYLTSEVVPHIDGEEELLTEELGVLIKIRDAKFISAQINSSPKTVQAYSSYLGDALLIHQKFGSARLMGETAGLPARDLCVFLGQEIERRRGNTELLEAVTDSLILWSLEETDPDNGIFLTRHQILEKVISAIPSAAAFVKGVLDTRLAKLAAKDGTADRAVRWYRRDDKFCLPFETREIVKAENSEDELLRRDVSDTFRTRATALIDPADEPSILSDVVAACHRTLELTFERQGLELAHFVNEETDEPVSVPAVSDHLDAAIEQNGLVGGAAARVAEISLKVLRGTFYESSECERLYLGKMSRTYVMMFLLKNDAKIVEYFRNMSGEFELYIGTDIIVRALSEQYLLPDDRMTQNTLEIVKSAGSTLILTEKCLEEVWTHLKATDAEFVNHYADMEIYIDLELARHIDRILIRSYFYAQIDPLPGVRRPAGWRSYIGNFVDYKRLHSDAGKQDLRNYLIERFGFTYMSTEEMLDGIDEEELEKLTEAVLAERRWGKNAPEKERLLAKNDAMQVLRVYQHRRASGELNHSNPYGYKTWWLTQAGAVRKAAAYLVVKHGSKFMMPPEFVLNFIALSPSEESVRNSFGTVFPSLLGIRLSSRLDSQTFKSAMAEIKEAFSVDEARARVRLADYSNKLKGDFLKRY